MVLDTHAEVFVWVGQSTDSKEKESAFEIGQVILFSVICISYIESTCSFSFLLE